MSTLDEFLGGVMVSLNRARVMADLQTVETAEAYARHELLQHFPVPRLRFGDVELSIPVAVNALGAVARGSLTPDERETLRERLLPRIAKLLGLRSLAQTTALFNPAIDAQFDALATDLAAAPLDQSLDRFAASLTQRIFDTIDERAVKTEQIDRAGLTEAIREEAAAVVVPKDGGAETGRVEIVAESHLLREQRPSDLITIKLTVREDGVEWQRSERSDGTVERKLLPE